MAEGRLQSYVFASRIYMKYDVKKINRSFNKETSIFMMIYREYLKKLYREHMVRFFLYDEKVIEKITIYCAEKAVNEYSQNNVKSLAIDELSFKKRSDYANLVICFNKCIVDVKLGKGKNTSKELAKKLKEKVREYDHTVSITNDISHKGCDTIDEQFPNAKHIIDKFHVKQLILSTLDEVSKEEQRESKYKQVLLKGIRLFMTTEKRMSNQQKAKLSLYPKTAESIELLLPLTISTMPLPPQEDKSLFDALYYWMCRCQLVSMKNYATSLKNHELKSLYCFSNLVTNII